MYLTLAHCAQFKHLTKIRNLVLFIFILSNILNFINSFNLFHFPAHFAPLCIVRDPGVGAIAVTHLTIALLYSHLMMTDYDDEPKLNLAEPKPKLLLKLKLARQLKSRKQ